MTRTYAIDANPLLGRRTGIGRCVEELVTGLLSKLAEDERLMLYCTPFGHRLRGCKPEQAMQPWLDHARARLAIHWTPYPVLRTLWNRGDRPSIDRQLGPIDAFLGTNYRLPPTGCSRRLTTFYDVALLSDPSLASKAVSHRFRATLTSAARRAQRIVTISEHAKSEIVRQLSIDSDRVTVLRPGVSLRFHAEGHPERERWRLQERYGIQGDYVLFVGTTDPRKNLACLLEAFALAGEDAPQRLVLAGQAGAGSADTRAAIERLGLKGRVVLTGFVDDDDLPALYRCARLFAFPSLIEGFGLPVVEAMACGCPVITSNRSCLPEVAGDAALLVDPLDVGALAEAIVHVHRDHIARQDLIVAGRERAQEYSWREYVNGHLSLLRGETIEGEGASASGERATTVRAPQ
ncbi:MAG: glycosyltransferase family 1 protein [Planctomycetota bacterium]